jgi:hypothetical protein
MSTATAHVYEVRPRRDRRDFDLISDALPFGRLWYGEPDAVRNAINYGGAFGPGLSPRRSDSVSSKNLVDRAVRERDDEEVSVRSSVNVGADAEASPKQQAFTLGDVELEKVVGDAIFQSWIIDGDLTTVAGEIEAEQGSSLEEVPRRADNHVTLILRPERAAADESKACRCDFKFPTELGVAVARNRRAVADNVLSANLAAGKCYGVQVGIGAPLTHAVDQVRDRGSKTRPGDHI